MLLDFNPSSWAAEAGGSLEFEASQGCTVETSSQNKSKKKKFHLTVNLRPASVNPSLPFCRNHLGRARDGADP